MAHSWDWVVSVDDHSIESADVRTDRMPAGFNDSILCGTAMKLSNFEPISIADAERSRAITEMVAA